MKNTFDLIKKMMQLTGCTKPGQLADKLEIASTRVSEWLGGKYEIDFEKTIMFCDKLKINPRDLFPTYIYGIVFKYREHRGSIDDSMATEKEFDSVPVLFQKIYTDFYESPKEIKSGVGVFDERINETTFPLLMRATGENEFYCIGYTDVNIGSYTPTV